MCAFGCVVVIFHRTYYVIPIMLFCIEISKNIKELSHLKNKKNKREKKFLKNVEKIIKAVPQTGTVHIYFKGTSLLKAMVNSSKITTTKQTHRTITCFWICPKQWCQTGTSCCRAVFADPPECSGGQFPVSNTCKTIVSLYCFETLLLQTGSL